jgi:hypothetical protein
MRSPPLSGASVTRLDLPHRDWADPGLDRALRPQPMPHNPLTPVGQPPILHRRQERLRLNGLGQQPEAPFLRTAVSGSSVASG